MALAEVAMGEPDGEGPCWLEGAEVVGATVVVGVSRLLAVPSSAEAVAAIAVAVALMLLTTLLEALRAIMKKPPQQAATITSSTAPTMSSTLPRLLLRGGVGGGP